MRVVANARLRALSLARGGEHMGQNQSGPIAIVTVHGTGDTAAADAGDKWFQQGAAFSEALRARLAQEGFTADIKPHLWTGANSAWDREQAANGLAARIRKLYKHYDTIHVIGHSHGGNVANDAAVLLKWGLRKDAKKERFDSLTTVGTPFFNVRTGWLQMLAGILFLIIAWGSAIVFPFLSLLLLVLVVNGEFMEGSSHAMQLIVFGVYFFTVGPAVLFMLRMSRQGVRRILRPRRGAHTKTSIFSIWHENDEAIAFLQRVEELKLEPFARGALFRGSRGAGVAIGVLAVLVFALAHPVLYSFGLLDLFDFNTSSADEDVGTNIAAVAMLSWLFAPAIFAVVYLLYRFLIGGAQEIAARGALNRFVGGVLRGIAMGRDGDQVLCDVGPRSHTHRTEDLVLSGECAARMQQNANGAAGALIEKYRWALFSVGGDCAGSLTALTTDAMTWDSLIHTTYFDQPEVAEAIAAHIAAKAREGAGA